MGNMMGILPIKSNVFSSLSVNKVTQTLWMDGFESYFLGC